MSENREAAQHKEATILVVEDEVLIRMVSADMLEDAGYRVLEAGDADEAIALLSSGVNVELMFTDIRMPGEIDGLELAGIVHARWPGIKLLVTSGHCILDNDELPDGGRFVTKPYRRDKVLAEIRRAMDAA